MTKLEKKLIEMSKYSNDGNGKKMIEKIKEKLLDYGFIENINNILEVPQNELLKKDNDLVFTIFLYKNHMHISTRGQKIDFFYNTFSKKVFNHCGDCFNLDDFLTKIIILFENAIRYQCIF